MNYIQIDNEVCSYNELIEYINACEKVVTNPINLRGISFLANLLKSLISDKEIEILHPISPAGYKKKFNTPYKEQIHFTDNLFISSISELTESLKKCQGEIILYTTGSTGTPKKIKHKFPEFLHDVIISEDKIRDKWLTLYSKFHIAGLKVLFQAIMNNNTIVYDEKPTKNSIQEKINQHQINAISATPTHFTNYISDKNPINSISRISLGGERSDKKQIELLRIKFPKARIRNIYATTESGALFSSDDTFFSIDKIDGNKIKIIDNEIYIKTSLLGKVEGNIKSEWYATGDSVKFINDINFEIIGRTKRTVNVGGYLVNLDEIQNILRKFHLIVDCYVYTEKNSVVGELICADIILRDKTKLSQFKSKIRKEMPPYQIPMKINTVDILSLNSNGKKHKIE